MEINKKRYNDIDSYFKRKFKKKIIKLPVDGGFSCPNRDGRISYGGCIYCSERGSGDFTKQGLSIKDQLIYQKNLLSKDGKEEGYIAYFQNFTNTYDSIDRLRKIYNEALSLSFIDGVAIATRADCIDNDVIELFKELDKKTFLFVELGLQSVDEKTIRFIKRGYTHKEFDENYLRLQKTGIKILAHIIVGLGDNPLDTISYVNDRNFWAVKIHSLYVQKNTKLYDIYLRNNFYLPSKEEYVEMVCKMLTYLRSDITVHRLTGDCPKDELVAPLWTRNKAGVLSSIDRYLKVNDLRQGDLYGKKDSNNVICK